MDTSDQHGGRLEIRVGGRHVHDSPTSLRADYRRSPGCMIQVAIGNVVRAAWASDEPSRSTGRFRRGVRQRGRWLGVTRCDRGSPKAAGEIRIRTEVWEFAEPDHGMNRRLKFAHAIGPREGEICESWLGFW